jgi:quinoprotein dehydrogenase-associated probable ABC transporter substrate-binding protein
MPADWAELMNRAARVGLGGALVLIAASMGSLQAAAQTAEAVDRSHLRVCADPNNLPFSNQNGEGFENKIADLLAAELGVPVRYTWYPDSMGFIRSTLNARACDIVIGTAAGNELLQNTNPYYRSTYAIVYRKDDKLDAASVADLARKAQTIGAVAGTPPTTLLAQAGALDKLRSYQLVVDTRFDSPGRQLVHDVATGTIDSGILWGPIAGYFAKMEDVPLEVVPLPLNEGSPRLDFRVTMGVRYNEPEWKREINSLIRRKQPEITRILLDYGVPLLDEQGQPITH